MERETFGNKIYERWPTKSEELRGDIMRFAHKYSNDDLDQIYTALIETYEDGYIPRYAQLKKIANNAGIKPHTPNGVGDYDQGFGGYLSSRCKMCKGAWPIDYPLTACPHCGKKLYGGMSVVHVSQERPQFTQAIANARVQYMAIQQKHEEEVNRLFSDEM